MHPIPITETDIVAIDGIAVIDRQGRIIVCSEAGRRICGRQDSDLQGQPIAAILHDPDSDGRYFRESLTQSRSFSNLSIALCTPTGEPVPVVANLTPLHPPGRPLAGVVCIFRNPVEMAYLTRSLQAKTEEILNEKNKLEAIFNSRIEGTFTINQDWEITSFNTAAERITGYAAQDALGRHCWEVFESPLCRNGCHMEGTLIEQHTTGHCDLLITRKDGQQVPVRVSSAPLFNAGGDQIGGVETFLDITELKNLETHLEERYHFKNIIGRSKSMQKIYMLLENVALSDSTVLITGESGTGKELVARAIHLNSPRRTGPFIAINCSAFVETLLESELFGHEKGAFTGAIRSKPGRFELAHRGTLFLDEIGDLSPAVQVKLLRVLETRRFERVGGTRPTKADVRFLTATNKDLEAEIHAGRFREDLFYRLNVFNIHLPPLRDRMDDLPLLVDHFLRRFRTKFAKPVEGLTPEAFQILKEYDWPGNIRDLENALEHAFVLCNRGSILPAHLPERLQNRNRGPAALSRTHTDNPLKKAERELLAATLERFGGHRGNTAAALGIDKSTLWRKMKKLGLL